MGIFGFHTSRGGGRSQIVLVMAVGFAFCAPGAIAQSTVTYTATYAYTVTGRNLPARSEQFFSD
jgi:hypothetical protein